MKNKKIKVIKSNNLKTLSIKVTEEINSKYLFDFLQTNILKSDLITTPNSEFYYSFIKSNMSYEIILFDKPENIISNFVLEPLLPLGYYENNSYNSVDLFYTNDYFIVYQNKKLILFKQISDVSLDDIVLYLLQTYKISIDNKIKIDDTLLENFKNNYIKNPKIKKNYQLNLLFVDKSFKILQSFVLIITILFGYLLYNNLNGKQLISKSSEELISIKSKYNNLLQIYQKNNKSPLDSMVKFFKYIKLNKIVVDTVMYKNKRIETILIHKSKKILLDTVTMYGKQIDINYIKYDKKIDKYRLEIVIEI
ncbi:MAG: hypothetical protein U9N59_05610 [Campylobacterota bacterium]|nr:hypothetical protein [Campylobacterota bacterium]